MLKLHRERKCLTNAVSQCTTNPPIPNARNEELPSTAYYMIDSLNKNQNNYNTLNSDVMSFTKNFDQVIRIRNSVRKSNKLLTKVKRENSFKSPKPETTKENVSLLAVQRRQSQDVNLKLPAIYKKLSTGVAYPQPKEEKRSRSLFRRKKRSSKEKYEMKLHKVLDRIKV